MAKFIELGETNKKAKTRRSLSASVIKSEFIAANIEAVTGADIIVSAYDKPVPDTLEGARMQARLGARFIQIKWGNDLVSSIKDGRLKDSQGRMLSLGLKNPQCILHFVGNKSRDPQGFAKINGRRTFTKLPMTYKSLQGALMAWRDRGGIVIESPASAFSDDIELLERSCFMYIESPYREFYPEKQLYFAEDGNEPFTNMNQFVSALQELKPVDDMRSMLRNIPGIGDVKVKKIWDKMAPQYTIHYFLILLRTGQLDKILNKKTADNIRKWLGA